MLGLTHFSREKILCTLILAKNLEISSKKKKKSLLKNWMFFNAKNRFARLMDKNLSFHFHFSQISVALSIFMIVATRSGGNAARATDLSLDLLDLVVDKKSEFSTDLPQIFLANYKK